MEQAQRQCQLPSNRMGSPCFRAIQHVLIDSFDGKLQYLQVHLSFSMASFYRLEASPLITTYTIRRSFD